jgi:hypothetical protein
LRAHAVRTASLQFVPCFRRLVDYPWKRDRRMATLPPSTPHHKQHHPTRSPKEPIMNINLRALVFGVAVAAAMTVTIDSVVAAESTRVVRLDTIEVTAHRDAVDEADVVHLDTIHVTAHKTN